LGRKKPRREVSLSSQGRGQGVLVGGVSGWDYRPDLFGEREGGIGGEGCRERREASTVHVRNDQNTTHFRERESCAGWIRFLWKGERESPTERDQRDGLFLKPEKKKKKTGSHALCGWKVFEATGGCRNFDL